MKSTFTSGKNKIKIENILNIKRAVLIKIKTIIIKNTIDTKLFI